MLEFGEEMGCWASDWGGGGGGGKNSNHLENHIMAENGNTHIQTQSVETRAF